MKPIVERCLACEAVVSRHNRDSDLLAVDALAGERFRFRIHQEEHPLLGGLEHSYKRSFRHDSLLTTTRFARELSHGSDRIGLASEAALHGFAETKLGNKAARVPVLSVKDLLKDL